MKLVVMSGLAVFAFVVGCTDSNDGAGGTTGTNDGGAGSTAEVGASGDGGTGASGSGTTGAIGGATGASGGATGASGGSGAAAGSDASMEADSDTGAASGGDAATASDDGAGPEGGSSGSGEGFFATYTIEGQTIEANCPAPDTDNNAPFLLNWVAGVNWNMGCAADHSMGLIGEMIAIQVDNIESLAGGAVNETSGGGFDFEARAPDHTTRTLNTIWENKTSLKVTGTYDPATRRIQGTFEASFGAPKGRFPEAQATGTATGRFNLVSPLAR